MFSADVLTGFFRASVTLSRVPSRRNVLVRAQDAETMDSIRGVGLAELHAVPVDRAAAGVRQLDARRGAFLRITCRRQVSVKRPIIMSRSGMVVVM